MSVSIWFQGHMYFCPSSSIDTCFRNEFVCISLWFQVQMYLSPRSSNDTCFCDEFVCISLWFQGRMHFSTRSSSDAFFCNGFMCNILFGVKDTCIFLLLLRLSFCSQQEVLESSQLLCLLCCRSKVAVAAPSRQQRKDSSHYTRTDVADTKRQKTRRDQIRNAVFLAFFLR